MRRRTTDIHRYDQQRMVMSYPTLVDRIMAIGRPPHEPDTAWIRVDGPEGPGFEGSWRSFGSDHFAPVSYRMDAQGRVWLRGRAFNPNARYTSVFDGVEVGATVVFYLPRSHRPEEDHHYMGNDDRFIVVQATDGAVISHSVFTIGAWFGSRWYVDFDIVNFRSFQSDEGPTVSDGLGDLLGGGGGIIGSNTDATCSAWIYIPTATVVAEPLYNIDLFWLSDGVDDSSPIQSVFPIWDAGGGVGKWNLLYGSEDLGTWVPDTWYHVEMHVVNHLDGTLDTTLTVDGDVLATDVGTDVSGSPGATSPFARFGVGNNADGTGTYPIYFDSPVLNGVTIDTFESGFLGAWDTVVGGAAVSTVVAHDGTHSLVADGRVSYPAYVGMNIV